MARINQSALFISYDGLLDPLGASQILPYLRGIAQHRDYLHIVSFEKTARFAQGAQALKAQLNALGIGWTPLIFTTRYGKWGKLWDLLRMYLSCLLLQGRYQFAIVHCRSYQAMQVGHLLKQLTGARTIFDMRGLWVDERVEGGLWQRHYWLDALLYTYYKRIERRLLAGASHIVVLTERVAALLPELSPRLGAGVTVIPCCADFEHFVPASAAQRLQVRQQLTLPADGLVLCYLGSLGTWYLLEPMLRLFASAVEQRADVHLLIITKDWGAAYEAQLVALNLSAWRSHIHIHPASREQVPCFLGAADIMLSFIKPSYSKIASSPTKLAEALAMGLPVICNAGVGDVDSIVQTLQAGVIVDSACCDFSQLVTRLDAIKAMGGYELRQRARQACGLEVAAQRYHEVYQTLSEAR